MFISEIIALIAICFAGRMIYVKFAPSQKEWRRYKSRQMRKHSPEHKKLQKKYKKLKKKLDKLDTNSS